MPGLTNEPKIADYPRAEMQLETDTTFYRNLFCTM